MRINLIEGKNVLFHTAIIVIAHHFSYLPICVQLPVLPMVTVLAAEVHYRPQKRLNRGIEGHKDRKTAIENERKSVSEMETKKAEGMDHGGVGGTKRGQKA